MGGERENMPHKAFRFFIIAGVFSRSNSIGNHSFFGRLSRSQAKNVIFAWRVVYRPFSQSRPPSPLSGGDRFKKRLADLDDFMLRCPSNH
jgi:hypothetical protein